MFSDHHVQLNLGFRLTQKLCFSQKRKVSVLIMYSEQFCVHSQWIQSKFWFSEKLCVQQRNVCSVQVSENFYTFPIPLTDVSPRGCLYLLIVNFAYLGVQSCSSVQLFWVMQECGIVVVYRLLGSSRIQQGLLSRAQETNIKYCLKYFSEELRPQHTE